MVARFNLFIDGLNETDRIQGLYKDHRLYPLDGLLPVSDKGALWVPGSKIFEKLTFNSYSNFNSVFPRAFQKHSEFMYVSTHGDFVASY